MDLKVVNNNSNISLIDIEDALKQVFDPEISFNVLDLGLIYEIHLNYNSVNIIMTLTTINCPEAISLPQMVKDEIIFKLNNPEIDVNVDVTFEPMWSTENMSEEVLLRMGLL
jgi:hypothetical protein